MTLQFLSGTGTDELIHQIADHLGSVRAVINGNASATTYPPAGFYSADDYAPYGTKSTSSASSYLNMASTGTTVSLRDGFTGKEEQGPDFGVGYVDFGARQYSPTLSQWLVPDPMGEKYYDVSPYAYCAGDPVNLVDPDGRRPIYSTMGYLLGTDDNGLQGNAIIMDSQYFHQGMSQDEALKYHLGMDGLFDLDAVSRFDDSFNSLSSRPDWDGYLTLAEANDWYRNGN